MYVDDSTTIRQGKTYRRVLLRTSYRRDGKVCHDTLANLSHASEEEIQALKLALKHRGDLSKLGRASDIVTQQGLCVGAVGLLLPLAKRLGLSRALGRSRPAQLILWLVMASVIEQGSRLSAVRLAQRHAVCDMMGLEGFHEDDLYQAMDWVETRQAAIEDRLFRHRYGDEKPHFYLYDVTSSYFEGMDNELAAFGYNRDKKRGKKQIVIGLMTDDEGRPITVEVFRGNTSDPQTVAHQIEKMAQRFGVKQVTLIGDRGMLKSAQIEQLQDQNFHYITALTKPQMESLIKQDILQYDLFDDAIIEITDNEIRYVLRRNPIRQQEIALNRESKLHDLQTLLSTQNAYLQSHLRAQVDVALKKITAKAQQLGIHTWVSGEVQDRTLSLKIDKKAKQQQARLDGCYVIKTDLSTQTADSETVHRRYKGLSVVESAFRTMKTVLLEMRGIYVRKAPRTRAHVFIIMLGYLLTHELQKLWHSVEVTVQEGLAELASICSIEVQLPGQASYHTVPAPRALGKELLNKAGVTLPSVVPCRQANVHTKKKLVSERK
jgi:hypothetical protein